ncbi:MAG: hypothetical protein R3F56_24965 [Planctomycetota bacterium]
MARLPTRHLMLLARALTAATLVLLLPLRVVGALVPILGRARSRGTARNRQPTP